MPKHVQVTETYGALRRNRRVQEVWDVNGYQVQTTVIEGPRGYKSKWYLVLSKDDIHTGDAPLVYENEDTATLEALRSAVIMIPTIT